MAMFVNTNVSSLTAQRNLGLANKGLDTSYQRLSSGLRINSAKDDAAGLQVSNRLTAQINGLNQGNRNANDGISLTQTTEGAMEEITGMMQRIRVLAEQSANSTNTTTDRGAIQTEVDQLSAEIDRIASQTSFGGQKLLDGTLKATFQVGAYSSQTIGFSMTTHSFSITGMAGAPTDQVDINGSVTGGMTDVSDIFASGVGGIDVSSASGAQAVLAGADAMLAVIDGKRAELGAVQNRMESTIRNQNLISENVSAARSRVRDADFAIETANLTQYNILSQAASTVLSQANQRPQAALQLLG